MAKQDFKNKLALLRQLSEGAGLFDVNGIPVSLGRTKDEIHTLPILLDEIRELAAIEQKRFGRLSKRYSEVRFSIRFLCEGILRKWTDDLLHNIETGTWILQEQQKDITNHV